ncbi:MAG TPA: SNF2-related protein [Woeseiaceae bacterium]|nr:SNF2-related protein [Woeseiaceae bacterium]
MSNDDRFEIGDLFAATARKPFPDRPPAERFLLNTPGEVVRKQLLSDFSAAESILILTGYSGLDEVIRLLARTNVETDVRLLFGDEPRASDRERPTFNPKALSAEIREHFLEEGLSCDVFVDVYDAVERLKSDKASARLIEATSQRLHGKVFVTDQMAALGSSNFSRNGLEVNLEVNARFDVARESRRYRETAAIADHYWHQGDEYTDRLIDLIGQLFKKVSWQEALAKACAELLEGEWAQAFLDEGGVLGGNRLWPHQRQGIAQALYVLARHGSVLIADATGSGKTLMGAYLVRAIRNQLAATGRLSADFTVMVCPPAVQDIWLDAAETANIGLHTHSQGVLSHKGSRDHARLVKRVARTPLLCVDEVHNFLNPNSNRTRRLLRRVADNVVVFTATPINKGLHDLIPIIDVLGADNLDEVTLDVFDRLLQRAKGTVEISDEELDPLKTELRKFTVRRTKAHLNDIIDRDPTQYTNLDGEQCRYPHVQSKTYSLNESSKDIELANEIEDLASQLYAVRSLSQKPIRMHPYWKELGKSEQQYLEARLHSAKALAQYQIRRCLRSSRIALVEHILGTEAALEKYEIGRFEKSQSTGNIVAAIGDISGILPANELSIELPEWLSVKVAHERACQHDIRIYRKILKCVDQMSAARERAKADHIHDIAKKHRLSLAFDKTPITLAYLRAMLSKFDDMPDILLAIGSPSDKDRVKDAFALGSDAKAIALCSDSLSEGVNLQQASALLHLDMPSVVRVAEQRVGRIDRLNSPHKSIEAWWPDDADAFALKADEKLYSRCDTVDRLIGANLELPRGLAKRAHRVSPQQMIRDVEEHARQREATEYEDVQDAFEPVRALVFGETAIVDQGHYENVLDLARTIFARVSIVRTGMRWAFFCLRGAKLAAPRWIYFPDWEGEPQTDLAVICTALRGRLGGDVKNGEFDAAANEVLQHFYERLSAAEKSLLPRMKQRALAEMHRVIAAYQEKGAKRKDQDCVDFYGALLRVLDTSDTDIQPDWDDLATRWLGIIRPIWYEKIQARRRRPLLLKDLFKTLSEREQELWPTISAVLDLDTIRQLAATKARLSSCIVGL